MSSETLMPAAVRFANYPGDRTKGVIGQRMGPNTLGEFLWVVAAEYDEATDWRARVLLHQPVATGRAEMMFGFVRKLLSRVFVVRELRTPPWHSYTVTDGPKGLLETLCVAEAGFAALERETPGYNAGGTLKVHRARIQRLMDECKRKRPTGPGGKHGDLHTPECGCKDTR